MKLLIDTCVILDLVMQREPFFNDARDFLMLIRDEKTEGIITVKSLMDIYYAVKHTLHNEEDTRGILKSVASLLTIVDSKTRDALMSLDSPISDYEDAVMAEAAMQHSVDYIITRNIRDFSHSPVPVLTPGDFLSLDLQ